MRGEIFETFAVAELCKSFVHNGDIAPLYFWRDKTGHEVDVIIDTGKNLIPLEIKSGETIDNSFFNGLRYFISLGPPASKTGILIHGGDALYKRENFVVRPWFQCV